MVIYTKIKGIDKRLITPITQFMVANSSFIDFERPLMINGKKTDYSITRNGDIISYKYYNTNKPRVIAHMKTSTGYHIVNLLIDGEEHTYRVHRLVAETFIMNPDPKVKTEVNHISGNKDDNSEENLEWASPKENINHAYKTGLMTGRKGEKHHMSTITEKQAIEICELLASNAFSMNEISSKMGVSYSIVKKIKNKQRWTHISKDYNFTNYTMEKKRKKKII